MNQTTITPRYTPEQREAWIKAKMLLKTKILSHQETRPLHIAMSLLRGKTREQIETPALNESKRIQRINTDKYWGLERKIQDWLDYFSNPARKKLYIFVDPTLSVSQKAVQSAHCAAEFQKQNPHAPWINGTMILLEWGSRLGHGNVPYCCPQYRIDWREPDMENKITAIAILSDYSDDLGKGYKLL